MSCPTLTRALSVLALAAAVVVPTSALTPAASAADPEPADSTSCTPTTEVPTSVTVLKDDKDVSEENKVTAWNRVKLQYTYNLSSGHCAGQEYKIKAPKSLHFDLGTTWNLREKPEGTAAQDRTANEDRPIVATMTYEKSDGGYLSVKLADYVEGKKYSNVEISGWVEATIDASITPNTTETLKFNTNDKTIDATVPVGECGPDCEGLPTAMGKFGWALAPGEDGTRPGSVVVQTPGLTPEMAGSETSKTFNWTDKTTSPDQAFDCDKASKEGLLSWSYEGRTKWGDPKYDTAKAATATVTSCSETEISGTVTVPAGQFARVYVPMKFSGPGSWTDSATLTLGDKTFHAEATVSTRNGGGQGFGVLPAQVENPPAVAPALPPEQVQPPAEKNPAAPAAPAPEQPAAEQPAAPAAEQPAAPATKPASGLAKTGATLVPAVIAVVALLGGGAFLIARRVRGNR
jgi:dihydrolipoamide acetyltransferase